MENSKVIFQRAAAGEKLVRLFEVKILRHLNRATVWRWATSGRIPAVKMGRDWFTVDSIVEEAMVAANQRPKDRAVNASASHAQAVANLAKRGLVIK